MQKTPPINGRQLITCSKTYLKLSSFKKVLRIDQFATIKSAPIEFYGFEHPII